MMDGDLWTVEILSSLEDFFDGGARIETDRDC
jgi:hypothetical protein